MPFSTQMKWFPKGAISLFSAFALLQCQGVSDEQSTDLKMEASLMRNAIIRLTIDGELTAEEFMTAVKCDGLNEFLASLIVKSKLPLQPRIGRPDGRNARLVDVSGNAYNLRLVKRDDDRFWLRVSHPEAPANSVDIDFILK